MKAWVLIVAALLMLVIASAAGGLFGDRASPTARPVRSPEPASSVEASPKASPSAEGLVDDCSDADFNGDSRLGPETFPEEGQVAAILYEYDRLAGESPEEFITEHWDPAANSGKGSWRYPPNNGYLSDVNGNPITATVTLPVGQEIDRFGSEFGGFLAPENTNYAHRGLPPSNLDDTDAVYVCNYHLYRVVKPLNVKAGPIAPAFGQPGAGLQYQLDSSLIPGAPTPVNVMWLIDNGFLVRIH